MRVQDDETNDLKMNQDRLHVVERGAKQIVSNTAGSYSSEERTENECTARFSEAGTSSNIKEAKMSRYSKMETSRMTLINQFELANLLKR